MTRAAAFPWPPPRAWFDTPEPDGPAPLTWADDGRVSGHCALWDSCHTGVPDRCLTPPRSRTDYDRFHTLALPVADGGRVLAGPLTFDIGHAAPNLDGPSAVAHYRQGRTAAHVRAVDGRFGIWCAGAALPDLTDADLRTVMSCAPSGDWRRHGLGLEMVGLLCVPVPGFNVPRSTLAASGLVASLVAFGPPPAIAARVPVSRPQRPAPRPTSRPAATGRQTDDIARVRERIAASIGRSHAQRVAALTARVHPARR